MSCHVMSCHVTWEECDTPMLGYIGEEEADKGRAPRTSSWNYYANFTVETEAYIARPRRGGHQRLRY